MNAENIISEIQNLARHHDPEPRFRLAYHVGLLEGKIRSLCRENERLKKENDIFMQHHITTLKEIYESLSSD